MADDQIYGWYDLYHSERKFRIMRAPSGPLFSGWNCALTLTVPAEIRAETAPVLSPEVAVSEEDSRLILRFDADRIPLEQVVQYAFRDLKAMDMKIAEISIGNVVKTILEQQEAAHAEKV